MYELENIRMNISSNARKKILHDLFDQLKTIQEKSNCKAMTWQPGVIEGG